MATITITIDMDNAVFDEAPASELAKTLYEIAMQIEQGRLPPFKGEDENGNVVAYVTDDAMGNAIPDRASA